MTDSPVIFQVTFTEADVLGMIEGETVPEDLALDRAREWGGYIADTLVTLGNAQLSAAVFHGQV